MYSLPICILLCCLCWSQALPTDPIFTYSPPTKKGYVAFGDSYAAGMGTGTTTQDGCRIGSNNFAELIKQKLNWNQLKYQLKMCSGDTTVGINRQINEWTDPQDYDMATMSVGGNDLDFGSMVKNCILEFNALDFFGWSQAECNKLKAQAKSSMTDRGPDGLLEKLRKAYSYVLDKSGSEVVITSQDCELCVRANDDTFQELHLYVTSYPRFFNDVDKDCDKTTFYWWSPGYNPAWDPRKIKLTTDLRRELNGLVDQLNNLIQDAVKEANAIAPGKDRVHFVDMNPAWEGGAKHRFCEAGDFHEPDENRSDTWFFLSGWKDVGDSGVTSIMDAIGGLLPGGLVQTSVSLLLATLPPVRRSFSSSANCALIGAERASSNH